MAAVTILAVIIAFIGAIQLTFQAQVDQTLDEILENREQNDDIKKILEAQGNLTKQSRQGLTKAINDTYYITIPEINRALSNITENQNILITLAVDENEDTEELKRVHNISKDAPEDQIKLEVNSTHVTINNNTRLRLPQPIQ
jgi:hypothetical protein